MRQASMGLESRDKIIVQPDQTAAVVALDRSEDEAIVLRFLMNGVSWDVHSREVKLPLHLARQLAQMLSEEIEERQPEFRPSFA